MIKASISPLHEAIFSPYIRHLLKKHFNAIHLLGAVPAFADYSILLLPNHSSWWDGFFIHFLKVKILKRPTYLMMLEEQLSKNRFFSHVGAYSINPSSARSNLQSLSYSRDLLQRADKPVVCIFPQGELLPWSVRPLGYKRGIDLILRKMTVPLNRCQVAFKCEFLAAQRADVFVKFADNHVVEPGKRLDIFGLEKEHAQLLDSVNSEIGHGVQGHILLAGKKSVNESFEALRRKIGFLRGEK
ncbi:lysophospholipid acyltransferase family protein [candidate division KSB1 bacterium]|nr:lysophospholipid acyltransferase family protein [candidate division KSB1 bacterium]